MNGLNPQQARALEALRAQAGLGWPQRTRHGDIATGCNTTTLRSLRKLGLISVSRLFLNGLVSADIEVKGA